METTLITLLIIAVIVFFAFWLIDNIPVPSPFNMVAKAIVGILAIIKVIALL